MTRSPVKITNAHKYYNKGKSNQLHVMDNVTLELPEQGLVAIFGRSGCGKTTLLNTVGGLDKIASGSIELFGQNVREDTDTLRNQYVGYIFQNYNLNLTDTVYENVAAALRLCGLTDETDISERVMAALGNVDMDKYRDRTPDTLSGGQQQRVAIARAIVKCPPIILADEPTGNLDEANTVLVMDILKELSKTRLVLLVTHEANLVDHYCDRVIEIVDGRVVSDRENREANGYVTRNKNHIYLGELEKTETAAPGVTVEYYGEPMGEIKLRIVNQNGKIFLRAEGTPVKLLEEGSEIKLMEGVFEEAPAEQATAHGKKLDMSRLTPVEGTRYGRLYHWKNALASAWRENFGKKQKKGKKLLRVCLFLLAVTLVFMTAAFGAGFGVYETMIREHNENAFYVPIEPDTDYGFLRGDMGDHGMEYTRMMGNAPIYDTQFFRFNAASFMTAESVTLEAEAVVQDVANAKDLKIVDQYSGVTVLESDSDILITTAVADKMLENSPVGYLDEYADLVGMVTAGTYYEMGGIRLRIAGVVVSDEMTVYMDSFALARMIFYRYLYMPVTYASDAGMTVAEGEVIYIDEGVTSVNNSVGAKLTINGVPLTVSRVIKRYTDMATYPDFVKDTYGEFIILTPEEYLKTLPEGSDPDAAYFEWILEHYFRYVPAFYQAKFAMLRPYEDVIFEEWAVAEKGSIAAYAEIMQTDPYYLCAAYLYHEDRGTYPTYAQMDAFASENAARIKGMMEYRESVQVEFDRFMEKHWNSYKNECYYVLSDADYLKVANGAGLFENVVIDSPYQYWDYDEPYYTNHLMIVSSDPAATEAYLTGKLGADGFLSPADVLDQITAELRQGVLITVITVIAVIALMCICVFFIMRSSFMSRVREVGILRAIGVTKRNLTFRFAVETALLLALTVIPGYLLSAWFIGSLKDAIFFSEIFYFPVWMAGGIFILLSAVTLLFGILPARALLRRTPSEILSKYDI